MPGISWSAPRPASSSSTYRSRCSKHSSQPISWPAGPSMRLTRSSRALVSSLMCFLQLELLPELSPRVMERLVEGSARGVEPLGQNVDWHLVKGQGNQHLALMRRQLGLDRARDLAQQLATLRLGVRRGARIREPRPVLGLERDLAPLPREAPDLHRRLQQAELVRPRGEAALAAEALELGQHRNEGVVGGLDGQ